MTEHLFFEAEYAKGGRVVEGTAVRYADRARYELPGGTYYDKIAPGALKISDAVLNIQHNRQRPIGRTNGGGLSFQDDTDRLRVRYEFQDPLTSDQRDALSLLERRVLRGFSLELAGMKTRLDTATRTRHIEAADARGIALVDRPAFAGSEAVLKQFAEADKTVSTADYADGFRGSYQYGAAETISDQPGRAVVRKRRFRPGAFRQSIEDPASEVALLTSRNPNDAVASKRSGTLFIEQDGGTVSVHAQTVAVTAAWRDLLVKRDAGLSLALQPVIKADSGDFEDVAENPADGTALIRTYSAVKLLGFMVTPRPLKGSESEVSFWDSAISFPV